jgi:hypothetical protein
MHEMINHKDTPTHRLKNFDVNDLTPKEEDELIRNYVKFKV